MVKLSPILVQNLLLDVHKVLGADVPLEVLTQLLSRSLQICLVVLKF